MNPLGAGEEFSENVHVGRLAQLGERLVYTQEVGGSIPSPPIIRKPRKRGAFAFGLTLQIVQVAQFGNGGALRRMGNAKREVQASWRRLRSYAQLAVLAWFALE